MSRLFRHAGALAAGTTLGGLLVGFGEALYRGVEPLYAVLLYGALWAAAGLGLALVITPFGRLWRRHLPTTAAGLSLALGLSSLVLVRFIVLRDILDEAPSSRWIALGAGVFAGAVAGALGLAASPLMGFVDRKPRRGYALALAALLGFGLITMRGDDAIPGAPAAASHQFTGQGVILVVVDTLRADALGAYGAEPHRGAPASPHFDAFANGSLLFRNVSAQASWTRPAVATLMTSRHVSGHNTMAKNAVLPASLPTIASALQEAGVHTAAVVTNYNLEQGYGFDHGFDQFRYLAPARYLGAPERANRLAAYNVYRLLRERFWKRGREMRHFYRSGHSVNAVAFEQLESIGNDRFFMWLHYMEPHDPYFSVDGRSYARVSDPHPKDAEAADMEAAYRDDVRRFDDAFGELLEGLRARGLDKSVTVIVVADHGEEFDEHGGFYHGTSLYEEQLHVPLAIHLPDGEPRNIDSLTRQIDVAPTVLARFGVAAPASWEGRDLLGDTPVPDISIAEEDHEGNRLQSIRRRKMKLILANPDNPRGLAPTELFDLVADPHEQHALPAHAGKKKALQKALDEAIEHAKRGSAVAGARTLDAESEAQLRALGYVQ